MSTSRKILVGFAGGLGLTVINLAASFVQFRLLLRYLGQNQAGIWLLFLSIGGYIVFFDLGIGPTLGREISFSTGDASLTEAERAGRIGTLIRTCTSVMFGLAFVLFALGMTAGWAYLRRTIPPQLVSSARFAWPIYVLGTAFNLVGQGWFAGIYGMGRVFEEKLLRSLGQLLGIGLLVAALWLHLGLTGLAVASVLQALVTIGLARRQLRLGTADLLSAGCFDMELLRRLAGPSLKFALTVLGGVLILQTDNLVIASMLGAGAIPNYQAVAKLVTTLMTLSTMLIVTSTPFVSQAFARNDLDEIRQLLGRNLKVSLAVMITLGSVLACFADRIVEVWLGTGHFVGFPVVWVLLTMMLLEAHHASMATATMATGRIVFLVPALLAGALNIGFSILLARHFGLLGVALGTLCAQVLTNNWYVPFYTMRQFHLGLGEHLRRVVGPLLLLLALTLGVGKAIRMLQVPAVASVLLGGVGVIAVGVSATVFLLLTTAEREIAKTRLWRRLGKLRQPTQTAA